MKQIQLFKPMYDKEEILSQISECLDAGWTGLGFKTIEFEERFKEYTGVNHAHFLNSATSGLHLALEIIKKRLSPNRFTVITTPLTFISDTHVIRHAGLYPSFVDIDEYLCIDPRELWKRILDLKSTLAVIYVGLGGNTGELNKIADTCKNHNIPLIFDASHCMGTYYNGRHIGNEADYTVFSFQSVKNLPTADSGMIVCKDKLDDNLARKLSWLGISRDTYARQTGGGNWDYDVECLGWKYHGNSIMASMGLVGLGNLKWQNTVRQQQAGTYILNLNSELYRTIPMASDCRSSRHLFQVRVNKKHRNLIALYAKSKGIQLGVHYKAHSEYNMYSDSRGVCPNAEAISKELLSLPIGPHLSEEDVEYVIEVLNAYKA